MFRFLDVVFTPSELERISRQKNGHFFEMPIPEQTKPDFRVNFMDSVYTLPDTVSGKVITNDTVADSITNKQGVIDTLHASGALTGGFGSNGGDSTLLWTALVVIAALALCMSFVWLYRRHLKYAQ